MTYVTIKLCRTCSESKPLCEFYAHAQMADGRLNICKVCTRIATAKRRRLNPEVQAYDRERAKRPARRARMARISKAWRDANPDAYRAQTAVNNAIRDGRLTREPCLFCRETKHVHGHHKDYGRPLEVVWLCAKCHHRLHALEAA